jgi:hypothetical protein
MDRRQDIESLEDERARGREKKDPLLGELVPRSFSEAGGRGWVNFRIINIFRKPIHDTYEKNSTTHIVYLSDNHNILL